MVSLYMKNISKTWTFMQYYKAFIVLWNNTYCIMTHTVKLSDTVYQHKALAMRLIIIYKLFMDPLSYTIL